LHPLTGMPFDCWRRSFDFDCLNYGHLNNGQKNESNFKGWRALREVVSVNKGGACPFIFLLTEMSFATRSAVS
jgi:hypothetical protein